MGRDIRHDQDFLDAVHRTNKVAGLAFRRGNAAGAHAKDKAKLDRRRTRRQEIRNKYGSYDDE